MDFIKSLDTFTEDEDIIIEEIIYDIEYVVDEPIKHIEINNSELLIDILEKHKMKITEN